MVESVLVVVAGISEDKLVVDITPLTLEVNTLVVVAKVNSLEEIILVVPIDPPTLLVNVFKELERELFVNKLVTLRFVPVALVNNKSVIVEVIDFNIFVKKLVVVALVNITLSLNAYFTSPLLVVDTVKLELVDEARKLNKLDIDVVAITPLMLVVMIPALVSIVFVLIKVEVETIPFTDEVRIFIALLTLLAFTKLAVVLATFPFTLLVNTKLLVLVEIVKVLLVEEATRF